MTLSKSMMIRKVSPYTVVDGLLPDSSPWSFRAKIGLFMNGDFIQCLSIVSEDDSELKTIELSDCHISLHPSDDLEYVNVVATYKSASKNVYKKINKQHE